MSPAASHTLSGEYISAQPVRPASVAASAPSDRFALWLVCIPVLAATAFSKFGVPALADRGIGLTFPIAYAVIAIAFVTGRGAFHTRRLVVLLIVLSALGLMQVMRGDPFSSTSLVLMAALGFAYVVCIRSDPDTGERALSFFRSLSLFIALLGVAQFAAQFLVGPELAFPIEHYLPPQFLMQLYNNFVPLYWEATTYKANGVLMLEPSVFSQICALGLLAELCHAQALGRIRILRLAAYVSALVVSYSGTGLMILAVCLPLYTLVHRRWDLLLLGLVFAVVFFAVAEPLNLEVFAKRATEFSASGSSAFARFVAWWPMFEQHMWPEPARAMFGYGAGAFQEAATPFRAAEMAHSKILFEFGVLGGLLYFGFVLYCIFSSPAPLILRIAICVFYFMNGAYSPTVTGVAMTVLLLWSGPQVARQQQGAAVAPQSSPMRVVP